MNSDVFRSGALDVHLSSVTQGLQMARTVLHIRTASVTRPSEHEPQLDHDSAVIGATTVAAGLLKVHVARIKNRMLFGTIEYGVTRFSECDRITVGLVNHRRQRK